MAVISESSEMADQLSSPRDTLPVRQVNAEIGKRNIEISIQESSRLDGTSNH